MGGNGSPGKRLVIQYRVVEAVANQEKVQLLGFPVFREASISYLRFPGENTRCGEPWLAPRADLTGRSSPRL
eukprot:8607683-Heterocapsa_arctica.AAC.1